MEKKLPEGWIEVIIEEIGSIVTGNTPSKKFPEYYGAAVPWVKPGDVKKSRISIETEEYLSDLGKKQARIIPEGSVMVTCIGDLGNVSVAGVELATNQQINSIVPDVEIAASKYVYYAALTLKPWLEETATSTTISMVNKSNFSKAPILLPPLPEQTRIAAKLDKLFGHLDALKTKLDRIPELLKNFRQQVLTQAVAGKLTEEWRKGKDLGEWETQIASECCEKVQSGGTPKKDGFSENGIPFLKVYNIVNNKVDFEYKPQFVTNEAQYSKIKKSILFPGDVLMNIVGPPLNKIAIVPDTYPEWNLNQAITLFRPKSYLINKFLYYFFCEGASVRSVTRETRGVVGQVNISLSQCRNFEIPIPPFQEQEEIVKRVEGLFAVADKIEAQYNSLKTKIDTLPQAILNKAFKGELVPQNPNDEPASVLLERVKGSKLKKNTRLAKSLI